ncbi:MAG: hypothetical protein FDZ69_00230 [Deltaproteobacteria bacterium]|nr:MAG: hypothetical protein FDZ69_00230 [Deltaproteobacteria bacterium]
MAETALELITDDNKVREPDAVLIKGPIVPKEAVETDYGNALRVAFYFGFLIFFSHLEKVWYCWSGRIWERDDHQSITEKVVQAVRNVLTIEIPWLTELKKDSKFADLAIPSLDFVSGSLSYAKIRAATGFAQHLLPLKHELDIHKDLITAQNCTVDLRNGESRPHDRNDFLTKIVTVNYTPGALCQGWIAFLERAFPNNPVGIRFLQKILGYSLTGHVYEKRFFILWGATGNNGKSLIINVINGILGLDLCSTLASESLVSGRVSAIRSDLAKLKGYRFVAASETDKKYEFNEALIKVLTGGDRIAARHPHEREIEFAPELKLFIATNPKPEFTLADEAMMKRVCVIPFFVSIPESEQNKRLTEELIATEAEGIFAWLVEGAVAWANEGLGDNPFNQDAAVIVHKQASISEFVDKCCDTNDRNAKVLASKLLSAFNAYKVFAGDPSPDATDKEFSGWLDVAGIKSKRSSVGIQRLGIKLNDFGEKLLAGEVEPKVAESSADTNEG